MSQVPLRRLTTLGLKTFAAALEEMRRGTTRRLPPELLESESFAVLVPGDARADLSRSFASRQELGHFTSELIQAANVVEPEDDGGLWSWLAVAYFDQICPEENDSRKVGETARYIFNDGSVGYNYRRATRHLIFGPSYLIILHGQGAPKCTLVQPVDVHPDMAEQLASVQSLISVSAVMQSADDLYYDSVQEKVRPGASDRKRPGNVRRLLAVCSQLDLTHDLASMTPQALIALLPPEFDRWR